MRLTASHPRGSVADMRRLGKILIVVLASLMATMTTYYATRIALNIWIDLGSTTFAEADVPKLVAMFAEATTLRDGGGQVFLELNRDTRVGVSRVHINPSEADRVGAFRHTYAVWRDLADYGQVRRAHPSRGDEVSVDVVVSLTDQDVSMKREAFPADSIVYQIGWIGCGIQLALSPDRRKILQAETAATAGTLAPFWRPAIAPCVTRGLFASVGLVGNTCIIRPSVLCGRDNRGHGAAVDYLLLRVLQDVRALQPVSPEAVEKSIRSVLANQWPREGFNNPRGDRLFHQKLLLRMWIRNRLYTEKELFMYFTERRIPWWDRWLLL